MPSPFLIGGGRVPKGLILQYQVPRFLYEQQPNKQAYLEQLKAEMIRGIVVSEGMYGWGRIQILNPDFSVETLWEC